MVDKYEALERLSKLRADGVLSDDEFAAEKARLLAGDDRAVSANSAFHSQAASDGAKRRELWIVPLALIAVAILIGINIGDGAVGTSAAGGDTSTAADTRLPACDSKSVRQMLTDGIEHSVAEKIATLRVLDLTNLVERSYDSDKPERVCAGDLTLNTGDEHIGFRLYLSSDGTVLFRTIDDPGPSVPIAASANETSSVRAGEAEPAALDPKQQEERAAADAAAAEAFHNAGLSTCIRTAGTSVVSDDALSCVKDGRHFTMAASVFGTPVAYVHADEFDRRTGRLPMADLDVPAVYMTEAAARAALKPGEEACITQGESINGKGWFSEPDGCEREFEE